MAEVEIWRSDVAKSSPEPLPSSSVPSDSAATEVSFPEYGSSTSRLMSLAEALSKEEILNVHVLFYVVVLVYANLYLILPGPSNTIKRGSIGCYQHGARLCDPSL
jgi:hypothetical protein